MKYWFQILADLEYGLKWRFQANITVESVQWQKKNYILRKKELILAILVGFLTVESLTGLELMHVPLPTLECGGKGLMVVGMDSGLEFADKMALWILIIWGHTNACNDEAT